MTDTKRTTVAGKAIIVDGNDIDTDRIIPARYLRCVTFDGLGQYAFEDDRKQLAEKGSTHPFDDESRAQAEVLLVHKNFGCGSSREHAPQSLNRWNRGIKVLVGESFAEIFFGNCVALGIPCVTAGTEDLGRLMAAANADATVSVDLESLTASCGDVSIDVAMPDGARKQLLTGRWDSTVELLAGMDAVESKAAAMPYFQDWN